MSSLIQSLKELLSYKEMLKNLTLYDLRTKYRGSVIGFLWSFLNPLLLLTVYYVVFSTVMRVNLDYYYLYMFIGLLPWTMFQTSLLSGVNSIINNSNLVKKIYFPREIIPLSVVMSSLINYFFGMVIVTPFLFLLPQNLGIIAVAFPFAILSQTLFTLGIVFMFSALNVFFRDIGHILSVLIMAWFYFTPVVYPVSMIPESVKPLFSLNPMKLYIENFQDVFYYNRFPDKDQVLLCSAIALVSLLIGWYIFKKSEKRFAEEI